MTRRVTRRIIALILAAGFLALIGFLLFVSIPEANNDIIKVLTGFFGGAFVTMVSFYFGDSEGRSPEDS